MNKDDDPFQNVADFFEKLFGKLSSEHGIEGKIELQPIYNGDCSCCFLFGKGYHMIYPYADGEIAQLFICLVCGTTCLPEEPCKVEGCSFEDTYNIYVTDKNKRSSFQ